MPLFEYKCQQCGHVFEVMLPHGTPKGQPTCPACGETEVERLWSPFAGRTGKGGGCGSTLAGFG